MTPIEQETDALSGLEERIQQAVALVARLRREKEAAQAEAAEARAQASRYAEELKVLQAERKQVRGRIEKLLGQIDELSVE
jgi:FtsZ-binding cell division protein ZapB